MSCCMLEKPENLARAPGRKLLVATDFDGTIARIVPRPQDAVIEGQDSQPYVVISTRCAHLGCPVRYVGASQRFICPCHGGVYDFQGKVSGGPPVRPLDRFSVNSELERFAPRDPSNHLDGLWQYLYPSRPTT